MSRISSQTTCLDVGCGTGIAEEFLGPGQQVTIGLEIAKSMVQIAKKRSAHAEYVCGSGLHIPFADDTFGATFSFSVMHHIQPFDRRQLLREMTRVTVGGGYVLTFEHNPMNPVVRHIVRKCAIDEGVELIHPSDMLELHKDAGLQVINVRYLVFFPRLLSFLEPFESLLHRIPVGGQYEVIAKKRQTNSK